MATEDYLQFYPERSFTDNFSAKQTALQNLGAEPSGLNGKKQQLESVFEYDSVVKELFEKVKDKRIRQQVDPKDAKNIERHFRSIRALNNILEQLRTTNPRDLNQVFEDFDRQVQQMGFAGKILTTLTTGAQVHSQRSYVDEEIENVRSLLAKLENKKATSESEEKILALEQKLNQSLAENQSRAEAYTKQLEQALQLSSEIQKTSAEISENQDKYRKAAETAENWLATEGKALSVSIGEKSAIFREKGDKHRLKRIWPWLATAAVLGVATAIAAGGLILELNGDHQISIGTALLRFSLIAVLSSGAFVAYRQYYIHRRLNESYEFKAIALSIMEELVKSYSDPSDRASILSQAISIIFTEPAIKEDRAVQQRIIDELVDVLKSRIEKT